MESPDVTLSELRAMPICFPEPPNECSTNSITSCLDAESLTTLSEETSAFITNGRTVTQNFAKDTQKKLWISRLEFNFKAEKTYISKTEINNEDVFHVTSNDENSICCNKEVDFVELKNLIIDEHDNGFKDTNKNNDIYTKILKPVEVEKTFDETNGNNDILLSAMNGETEIINHASNDISYEVQGIFEKHITPKNNIDIDDSIYAEISGSSDMLLDSERNSCSYAENMRGDEIINVPVIEKHEVEEEKIDIIPQQSPENQATEYYSSGGTRKSEIKKDISLEVANCEINDSSNESSYQPTSLENCEISDISNTDSDQPILFVDRSHPVTNSNNVPIIQKQKKENHVGCSQKLFEQENQRSKPGNAENDKKNMGCVEKFIQIGGVECVGLLFNIIIACIVVTCLVLFFYWSSVYTQKSLSIYHGDQKFSK